MSSESTRRAFLRTATLAGAALATGASAVSVTGCDGKKKELEQKVKDQQAEIDDLKKRMEQAAAQEVQVSVDDHGNLVIADTDGNRDLRQKLGQAYESHQNDPHYEHDTSEDTPKYSRAGVRVKFSYDRPGSADTGGPEEHQVNSLCNC